MRNLHEVGDSLPLRIKEFIVRWHIYDNYVSTRRVGVIGWDGKRACYIHDNGIIRGYFAEETIDRYRKGDRKFVPVTLLKYDMWQKIPYDSNLPRYT